MDTNLLQSVGIDVAKDKFDVCIKENKAGRFLVKGTKSFENNAGGPQKFFGVLR